MIVNNEFENKTKEKIENKDKDNLMNNKVKNIKDIINGGNGKESIIMLDDDDDGKKMIGTDYIFGDYIDSEKELEIEKNKKKKRRLKIDLDKNNYYNFLIDGFIYNCQVRKGIKGKIEQYEEKKDNIFGTQLIFEKKPILKKYNKNDIKINNKYKLCENLREEEIIPELYEDDINNDEVDTENMIKEIAISLRGSIDKSLNSSINRSIQQSYNQSYADGIYDSIHGSKLKLSSGKGILGKLNQVFGSIAEMPENDKEF